MRLFNADGATYCRFGWITVRGYDVAETQLANGQLTWNFQLPAASTSSILSLLRIAPDGSTTVTQLDAGSSQYFAPGNIVPDGQGGVLATWAVINVSTAANGFNAPLAPQPYQAARVSSGAVVNTYTLPNSPQNVAVPTDSNLAPIPASLALGENGTAFASYPATQTTPKTISCLAQSWFRELELPVEFTGDDYHRDSIFGQQFSSAGFGAWSCSDKLGRQRGRPCLGSSASVTAGSGKLVRFERSGNASIDGRASRFFGSSLAYSKRRASGKQGHYSSSCGEHYSD